MSTIDLPLLAFAPEAVLYTFDTKNGPATVTKIRLSNGRTIDMASETPVFSELIASKTFRNRDGALEYVKIGKFFINPCNVRAVETLEDGTIVVQFTIRYGLKITIAKDSTVEKAAVITLIRLLGNNAIVLEASGEVTGL